MEIVLHTMECNYVAWRVFRSTEMELHTMECTEIVVWNSYGCSIVRNERWF